jgi:hypothetical protein
MATMWEFILTTKKWEPEIIDVQYTSTAAMINCEGQRNAERKE